MPNDYYCCCSRDEVPHEFAIVPVNCVCVSLLFVTQEQLHMRAHGLGRVSKPLIVVHLSVCILVCFSTQSIRNVSIKLRDNFSLALSSTFYKFKPHAHFDCCLLIVFMYCSQNNSCILQNKHSQSRTGILSYWIAVLGLVYHWQFQNEN